MNTTICALSGNHAYVKTLYDVWIPEFGSGMDPDPAGFRVVGSGPAGTKMSRSGFDPDPAGSRMSRSGLDPDPAGSENCGSGAPLVAIVGNNASCMTCPRVHKLDPVFLDLINL